MLRASISVTDYFALATECHTQNQFNKLHIHLENILAPAEFAQLRRLSERWRLPDWTRIWFKKIDALSPGLFEQPKGFTRQALTENILLYRDASRDPASKSLLIGFAGNARRLMIPISLFLQCLSSQAWDVVLLRKGPEKRSYLAGLEGDSNSFAELIRYVGKLVSARHHYRVITVGTSSGGFPSIPAAILMNAARGVSICGAFPRAPLGEWLQCQRKTHNASSASRPELSLVYGADFAPDREAACAIQAACGGRLCPVAGVAEHNVLNALLSRGKLASFLETLLA